MYGDSRHVRNRDRRRATGTAWPGSLADRQLYALTSQSKTLLFRHVGPSNGNLHAIGRPLAIMEARMAREVRFENAAGVALAGSLELPPGRVRAIALFAHCFTCTQASHGARRVSTALAAQGIATLRFDFTGLGKSEGECWPKAQSNSGAVASPAAASPNCTSSS